MARIGMVFDNGATRARARAWGLWVLFACVCIGLIFRLPLPAIVRGPFLMIALALGGLFILVRRRVVKIPVLNYHSVSAHPEWLRMVDELSIRPSAFERQLAYLKRRGYRSMFISEVRRVLAGEEMLDRSEKHVALTFDDGYADAWIAVFPLLKKYGMKATLFVSTAFIADAEKCRPTIEEMPGDRWACMDWSGYLSWPELNAMKASGLVEIQSHGNEHTRVFAGRRLKGFVGPGRPNLWVFLNSRPGARQRWWREMEEDRSLWGHPVYEQAPALARRAYFPDSAAVNHILSWAHGTDVFSAGDWLRRVRDEWMRYQREHEALGEWESEEEYERRIEDDLTESMRALAEKCGVRSDVLCWPENAFSDSGERIARRSGYSATVSNRHGVTNAVGGSSDRIVRVFIGSPAAGVRSDLLDFMAFVLEVKVFEGWYILYPPLALMHGGRKLVLGAKRRWACRRGLLSMQR